MESCVCALTASAFAWNAIADDENTGVNYNNENNGGAWYFYNPNHGASYEKETTFHALDKDSVLSIAVERNETGAGFTFGTYTYDFDAKKFTSMSTLGTVGGNNSTTIIPKSGVNLNNNGAVYSEAFSANEVVGLWVKEANSDLVYYSDNRLTLQYGANSKTVTGYTDASKYPGSNYVLEDEFKEILKADPDNTENKTTFTHMQYTEGMIEGGDSVANGVASVWFDDSVDAHPVYDNPDWKGYTTFGWLGEDPQAAIKLRVTGIASGAEFASHPSGGPLPGVWATIVLAGAAGTYLRRRKNK